MKDQILANKITISSHLAGQINYMNQLLQQVTAKASKDVKDLSLKGKLSNDIQLLSAKYQALQSDIWEALENELPEDKHFRFIPSKRKPQQKESNLKLSKS